MPPPIVDSHIHLWPARASNSAGHSWMTPGMPLAKEHLLTHYFNAAPASEVDGVVYVETDRAYNPPKNPDESIASWGTGPLDEVKFVREMVEGKFGPEAAGKLWGVVLWAPVPLSQKYLVEWLRVAEESAGPEAWRRVKGFRYLLQGFKEREAFEALVEVGLIDNLRLLAERGFVFDVGIDQNGAGSWQLEIFARFLHDVELEGLKLVLNHFCKPKFGPQSEEGEKEFVAWKEAVAKMAKQEGSLKKGTFMKLSGAFSELTTEQKRDTEMIVESLLPWVKHVFECFGADRVMFGSDWPVCNLGGPDGDQSWGAWREVVRRLLNRQELNLSDSEKEMVWNGSAKRAYGLEDPAQQNP